MEQLLKGLSDKFEVNTTLIDSSCQIQLREISSIASKTLPLHISLQIPLDNNSYALECFEVKHGGGSEEILSQLYSIKVDGSWSLKTLETDLHKMVRREFKTFRPRYFPF